MLDGNFICLFSQKNRERAIQIDCIGAALKSPYTVRFIKSTTEECSVHVLQSVDVLETANIRFYIAEQHLDFCFPFTRIFWWQFFKWNSGNHSTEFATVRYQKHQTWMGFGPASFQSNFSKRRKKELKTEMKCRLPWIARPVYLKWLIKIGYFHRLNISTYFSSSISYLRCLHSKMKCSTCAHIQTANECQWLFIMNGMQQQQHIPSIFVHCR